ncbi:unnamed protein product [Oppiella nova]|uniref:Uncharacterized protein n=1 Tax=Oppiella nova TaxID=334625 RepID=A0A7R9M9S4_9ACAR|nr:unnamed protein product [Oppiella nova]CAG2173404.1 unnamed protein product [Oppiella nova]
MKIGFVLIVIHILLQLSMTSLLLMATEAPPPEETTEETTDEPGGNDNTGNSGKIILTVTKKGNANVIVFPTGAPRATGGRGGRGNGGQGGGRVLQLTANKNAVQEFKDQKQKQRESRQSG